MSQPALLLSPLLLTLVLFGAGPVPEPPSRPGPEGGGASTSQGRPYSIFRRALEHGNLLVAEATATGTTGAESG